METKKVNSKASQPTLVSVIGYTALLLSILCVVLLPTAHHNFTTSAIATSPTTPLSPTTTTIYARASMLFERSLLNGGPPGGELDSGELFIPLAVNLRKPHWLVGWKPLIQTHQCSNGELVELVHHINILEGFADREGYRRIMASYDKGAAAYHLPPGYGVPWNESLPHEINYHLLTPQCWDFTHKPRVQESSGMELYFTNVPPKHNTWMFGFMNSTTKIDPGTGVVDFTAALTPTMTAGNLGDKYEILAIHLHTHNIYRRKWFEIIGKDGRVRFRSPVEATGYGPERQSMRNLVTYEGWPKRLWVHGSDTLVQHCELDTSTLHERLLDGVSQGQEMCGALMFLGGSTIEVRGGDGTGLFVVLDHNRAYGSLQRQPPSLP